MCHDSVGEVGGTGTTEESQPQSASLNLEDALEVADVQKRFDLN